ncbi:PDC sensor domain-containing protein [Shewanella algae]|jgi:hypothetical protein|uniref:PDC sensor domain-containing protein n=1 Tax=Shewanella algae TaxID=38313 RepID=UPI001AAF9D91|nr:PDC sensor domain-containing protein [Shewanella algae]MBO2586183.1 PDC sensor domain-containing protein [Shewanella algae]MBO2628216.1 PDC sensor domain-containing protein [Shewanella algae]MCE9773910.1 PDC sensor domain-containing protein [Shewanella algae]
MTSISKFCCSKSCAALFSVTLLGATSMFVAAAANANDYEAAISELANTQVKSWLGDPLIVDSIKQQNSANAELSKEQILDLDKQWRAQVAAADKPLVDKLLNNPLSDFLRQKLQQSNGLYTEIFVMDDKGLNVGQSAMTSDYWQGDEAKWQQTFAKGPDSIHISEVEEDESTQSYQSQLSLPVVDPSSGAVIGAITLGINVELL